MRHILAIVRAGVFTFTAALASSLVAANEAPEGAENLLVLPFAAINPAEAQPWLGKSIQQSIVADLTVAAPGRVLSADTNAPDDATAIDAAKKAGAAYVVRGSFATAGADLRITGQVLDAGTGKPVTALKATGPVSGVFTLEDELAAQARRRLALTPPRPTTEPALTAEASVPPMEPLRVAQARQPADPYVQAYVAPLEASSSPDRRQLDYDYYYGQPGGSLYLGFAGWGGFGLGWGVGFNYYGGCWGSRNAWGGSGIGRGSFGAGGVNSTAGTALAPGVVFHPSGHASAARAGGAAGHH